MSALSYYFEREGLLTTGISLVRENSESMQPPRALWVSFPLGRPLGVPGNPEFQHEVIAAALALLNRSIGPVLEDFPRDVPPVKAEHAAACPVSFARENEDDGTWQQRLLRELHQIEPWYELARRRRGGRTLVGIAEQAPAQNLQTLAEYLDKGDVPSDIPWLKRAIEDIKAYYTEAMTAQPGDYDSTALAQQFWSETCFGSAILTLYQQFQNSDDDQLKLIARMLAPREAVGGATGPERGYTK